MEWSTDGWRTFEEAEEKNKTGEQRQKWEMLVVWIKRDSTKWSMDN